MSGRRRRSDSLWDRKEDMGPQTVTNEKIPWQDKELHSSLEGDDSSPKRSNSEANDALISGDFPGPPMQGNENIARDNDNSRDRQRMNTDPAFDEWENQYNSRPSDDSYGLPYRAGGTGNMSRDRGRSRSPNRNESRGRDRRSRSRSRGRGRSPLNRVEKRSGRGEFSGDDRNRKDYHRDRDRGNKNANDDQDHRRRQSTQTSSSSRAPCKFFSLGKCNRNNCKFSHDNIQIQAQNSSNNIMPQVPQWNNVELASFDGNIQGNTTWNQSEKNAQTQQVMPPEANATMAAVMPGNSYFQQQHRGQSNVAMMTDNSEQIPPYRQDFIQQSSMNGSGQDMFSHQVGKPLETWKNDIPPVPVSLPQIANALELLYASSAADSIKPSLPSQQENQTSSISTDAKQEPPGNLEGNEKRIAENPGKSEAQGKVEESNISNDEKAMRQFKIALVEFVKEILKPTWKEGKMSREVYKTIVKKVVDKVTSTIQGIQIPKTQEKIDQYLAFSKSKITKLVEAYVGRFLKA